jgi:hypothetical protein
MDQRHFLVSSFSSFEALPGSAEILGKMGERAHHGIGGEPAKGAQRPELHGVAKVFEHEKVLGYVLSGRDLVDELDTPRRADAAGRALAARLDGNSMAKRACFAISTVSSNTTTPP